MHILEHFKLKYVPYEKDISSDSLYESAQVTEALARLLYSCQRRSMAVITGEVGSGKSTVFRLLESKLDKTQYCFIYIADSQLTPRNFYATVLTKIGVQAPSQLPKLKHAFKSVVTDLFESKQKTCIIAVDEAQVLELSMLQELRFIMNFGVDSYSPIGLILAGEPQFRTTIRTLYMAALDLTGILIWIRQYDNPVTVEEISMATGLPAMYVEDELERLIYGDAIAQAGKKYSTNFIIMRLRDNKRMLAKLSPHITQITNVIHQFMHEQAMQISQIGFYGSDSGIAKLGYIIVPLALRKAIPEIQQSNEKLKYGSFPPRKDGGYGWFIVAETEDESETMQPFASGCNQYYDRSNPQRGMYCYLTLG